MTGFLQAWSGVSRNIGQTRNMAEEIDLSPGAKPALQRRVVRHPENPSLKISARLALAKMLEQRQEYFLQHFLRIRNGDAK